MKKLSLTALVISGLLIQNAYAGEEATSNVGQAAVESRKAGTKWYIATALGASELVAFGLIIFLAASDPTTFSHSHSHSHSH